jgi:F-type H+-transporting ATPase subunit b
MELFVLEFLHSQIFWTTVAFLVLLGILGKFVIPAVTGVLDARIAKISGDLNSAKSDREQAAGLLTDYEAKLAQARKEAGEIVTKARGEAEALASQRLKDVEAEIAHKAEEARKSIAGARAEALRDIQAEVALLTVQVAEKILEQSVDAKLASKLTDEALKRGLN